MNSITHYALLKIAEDPEISDETKATVLSGIDEIEKRVKGMLTN
jgi:hypothetical protein